MRIRAGVHGMGRIGRDVPRSVLARDERSFEVGAITDVAPPATVAHLLGHDSTCRWNRPTAGPGELPAGAVRRQRTPC